MASVFNPPPGGPAFSERPTQLVFFERDLTFRSSCGRHGVFFFLPFCFYVIFCFASFESPDRKEKIEVEGGGGGGREGDGEGDAEGGEEESCQKDTNHAIACQ